MTEDTNRPNPSKLIWGLVLILFGIGIIFWSVSNRQETPQPIEAQPSVVLEGRTFQVEIADTEPARYQGLSGREGLDNDQAMLFVFDEPGQQCFWMRDMKFDIDILWFDADKRLAHQEREVSKDSYPQRFCPDVPAKYVLETRAGTADSLDLQPGAQLGVEPDTLML